MFDLQFGWDVLQDAGTNRSLLDFLTGQLAFIRDLGRAGKVGQDTGRRAPSRVMGLSLRPKPMKSGAITRCPAGTTPGSIF